MTLLGNVCFFLIALTAFGGCNAENQPGEEEVIVAVTKVSLDKVSLNLTVGDHEALIATVFPDNATDKTVSWTSSKPSVATVSKDGVVTALSEGNTEIIARAEEYSATCSVVVSAKKFPVTAVRIDKSSLELIVGETKTLKATVEPENATEKTITWSSSKPSVATISENGEVMALSEGSTEIIAQVGECRATCSVVVSAKNVPVTAVVIDKTSLELFVGDNETLIATIKPDNATDKTIAWYSSDNNVATVSNPGGVVYAVKEGVAIIYASADGQEASCRVTVDYHRVSDIELSTEKTFLYPSEKTTISATVIPSNATYPELSWRSSNNEIAVVDDGRVTAVNPGKVTITASNRDIQKQIEITVLVPLLSVSLDRSSASMFEGTNLKLHVTFNPSDADLREPLTWSSSNIDVATVNNDGVVSALKPGKTNITLYADGKTALCTISVIGSGAGNEGTEEEIWK